MGPGPSALPARADNQSPVSHYFYGILHSHPLPANQGQFTEANYPANPHVFGMSEENVQPS